MTIKTNRKENYGQYFISTIVTKVMVKLLIQELKKGHILNNSRVSELSVLEPAAGNGSFLNTLIEYGFKNITAFEIDEYYFNLLNKKFRDKIDIKNLNFLESSEEEKYDLIIGNPPYLGQNYASEIFQEYVQKYPICKEFFFGNMDLIYWFIHQAIRKLKQKNCIFDLKEF